jgi:hypothetical protein
MSGPVGEGDEPQVQHERWWRVARSCSTCEVPEQRRKAVGGGCGGKTTDQGEQGADDRVPDAKLGERVERTGPCAGSSRKRQAVTVHRALTPCHLLLDSFYALKREAAPGVDGMTWKDYETDLDKRLEDLHSRVHRGTYRAQPAMKIAGTNAETEGLRIRSAIFMLGGAPTAREVLPDKSKWAQSHFSGNPNYRDLH